MAIIYESRLNLSALLRVQIFVKIKYVMAQATALIVKMSPNVNASKNAKMAKGTPVVLVISNGIIVHGM
jgi:hypothetical protein